MQRNWAIIIGVILIIIIGALVYKSKSGSGNVVGCYVMHNENDVYTLNLMSQKGKNVEGRMVFKNFQKDSSQGAFTGTYQDRILLGDYSFQSEGLNSVVQVAFKKVGDSFIRGQGDMSPAGERFSDVDNITYDSSQVLNVFKKTNEACATSL
jgi:hypothetical protein